MPSASPSTLSSQKVNTHDSICAVELTARTAPRCLLADTALDTNATVDRIAAIPCTAKRVETFVYDKALHKARPAVECTFNVLKQARRFACGYAKTARNCARGRGARMRVAVSFDFKDRP